MAVVSPLLDLPEGLLYAILQQLPGNEPLRLTGVSRELRAAVLGCPVTDAQLALLCREGDGIVGRRWVPCVQESKHNVLPCLATLRTPSSLTILAHTAEEGLCQGLKTVKEGLQRVCFCTKLLLMQLLTTLMHCILPSVEKTTST